MELKEESALEMVSKCDFGFVSSNSVSMRMIEHVTLRGIMCLEGKGRYGHLLEFGCFYINYTYKFSEGGQFSTALTFQSTECLKHE